MKWLFAVSLLFPLAHPAILKAETPAFIAIANATEVRVKQGNVSDPLTLQIRAVGSLAPVSGVQVTYDADPSLILLSHEQFTDSYGYASIRCIALGQQGGRIQATVSNGAVIMFNVVVDPQGGTQIHADQQAYFEWQGTSTSLTASPLHAVISSSDTDTQNEKSGIPVEVRVVSGTASLLDASGQPAATFSTQTDSAGGINFNMQFPATGNPDDVSAVTISAGDASTSVLFHAVPQSQSPVVSVVSPASGTRISLGPDTSGAVPIQLKVTSADGAALQGISLRPVSQSTDQEVLCTEPAVTDATGAATCLATARGAAGPGSVSFVAGGLLLSPSISFVEAAGAAAVFRIISGNRQNGLNGQDLPELLTAWLMDTQGNTIPNAQVTWESDGAVLSGESKTSDSQGQVTAHATLGNRPGSATVTVHAGSVSAAFTLFNTSSGQLAIVDGDGQIGNPGQPFGKAIAIRVSAADGSPVIGAAVTFTVVTGAAALDTGNAVTGPDGVAQSHVTAGTSQGPITIEATLGTNSAQFHLFSLSSAASKLSVTDWNGNPAALVPGALMKLSFQPADASAVAPFTAAAAPFPTSAGALRISVGQTPAPVASLSISDEGVATATIQIPWEISSEAIGSVTVWINNAASAFTGLALQPAGPAVQMADAQHPSVWSPDGTLIPGAVLSGSVVQIRFTGSGPFQPAAATNTAGANDQAPALPVLAFLDGYGVPVTTAAADSTTPGVTEIGIALPNSLTPGAHQLSVGVISSGSLVLSPAAELDIQ